MTDKKPKFASYIVTGATALYPRIDKTYKFENNGRIPCAPTDDGAEYTMSLVLTKEQAVPLYNAMKTAYNEGKDPKWKEFPPSDEVFERNENGEYIARTKLKGAFNGEPTSIAQFDSSNNKLPSDFMLTTGSKINVLVSLVVYDPKNGSGISLRLRQVQVIDLAEMKTRSAFDTIEGGFNSTVEGFATDIETPADKAAEADEFDEAPKPSKTKAAVKAKPKSTYSTTETKNTKKVEDYDEVTEALENLDFDE